MTCRDEDVGVWLGAKWGGDECVRGEEDKTVARSPVEEPRD